MCSRQEKSKWPRGEQSQEPTLPYCSMLLADGTAGMKGRPATRSPTSAVLEYPGIGMCRRHLRLGLMLICGLLLTCGFKRF